MQVQNVDLFTAYVLLLLSVVFLCHSLKIVVRAGRNLDYRDTRNYTPVVTRNLS